MFMGNVFFELNEPLWSLRCFLKAREIRELRVGEDTVDTATVYNNIGVCMFMIERFKEALIFFELANAIIECHLGSQHE